jgi:hypothetical protein
LPWTKKPNDRRYYVRLTKRGGQKQFTYFGKGPAAEAAAAEDAKKRAEQLALNRCRKEDNQAWQQATQPLDQLAAFANTLMKGALVAGGYHQHDRGEWRRKREDQDTE